MYHDQGLPVVKHAGFEHAVNVTLGLPIVRTSLDHGTALDLAGSGHADARQPRRRGRAREPPRRSPDADAHCRGAAHAAAPQALRAAFPARSGGDRAHRARARRAPRGTPGRDRPGTRRAHRGGCSSAPAARSMPSRSIATSPRCCGARFAGAAHARLHEADALRLRLSPALAAARGGRLRIIGNLPYNISTPLLFHLLDASGRDRRPARHAAAGGRRRGSPPRRRRATTGG